MQIVIKDIVKKTNVFACMGMPTRKTALLVDVSISPNNLFIYLAQNEMIPSVNIKV